MSVDNRLEAGADRPYRFMWRITEFSKFQKQPKIYSQKFYCDGHYWVYILHPSGDGKFKANVSFFLTADGSGSASKIFTTDCIRYFGLNYVNPQKNIVNTGKSKEFDVNTTYGYPDFLVSSKLHSDKYILKDTLVVGAEIPRSKEVQQASKQVACIKIPSRDASFGDGWLSFYNHDGNHGDVRVVASTGQSFLCHWKLLIQQSSTFRMMFGKDGGPPLPSPSLSSNSNLQTIELIDANDQVVDAFLRYIYGDSLNVSIANIVSLCALAQRYKVTDLSTRCEEAVMRFMEVPKYTCLIYNELKGHRLKILQEKCFWIIIGSLESVVHSAEFFDLDLEDMERLISSSLRPMNEKTLIEAILKWMEQVPERQVLLEDMLKNVDLYSMSAADLIEVRQFPAVRQSLPLLNLLLDAHEARHKLYNHY